MSEGRLFKIMYIMLDRGRVTAPELAEELEVSTRTIYRDIDELSSAGIPIYTEVGRNGGLYLLDHFVLDKVLLSEQEKQEVLLTLQSRMVPDNQLQKGLSEKLSALFQMKAEDWLEVDFSRWGNQRSDKTKFEALKNAIIQHRVIHIKYVSSYGTYSERNIQPLKLSYRDKAWYLKSYCLKQHAFRMFRCNRIIAYHITDELFSPVSFPEDEQEAAGIDLQFIVPQSYAYRIYDEFTAEQIEITDHGDLLIHATMSEDAWLIGFLLSIGPNVNVLHPQSIRNILAAQAKEIYEKNKS